MSRKAGAAILVSVVGLLILLAVVAAADPQDGGGRPPRGADGPPGPGGPPPGFGPGMFLAPAIMEIADANADGNLSPQEAGKAAEKFLRDADTEKKGSLDALALGRAMNRQMGPPPGGGPGGPPDDGPDRPAGAGPGRGGPGDFGPGSFLAPQILAAADLDKDGRLSADEAAKAAERFVVEADAKKKGSLDQDSLAAAINQRMGPPPGFGPGGPGGPMGQERKLVKQFDKNADNRLNREERLEARAFLKKDRQGGGGRRGPGGFGPPPGFGGAEEPTPKPGPHLDAGSVATFPGKPLYDPAIVRTLFLTFEDSDWEAQLADFHHTDVDLPATLAVDGKAYPNVGVHFRGLSSFMMVRDGHKRSLNIALDFKDSEQRLYGYKTLNLLNSHEDPTFLHTVLYMQIARNYIPAPKANFVKLVINGESWGLYVNAQQFDKVFLNESFGTSKGTRWKVKGSPGGGGGLNYVGDNIDDYKRRYEIKSEDNPASWKALIALCKTLSETPTDRLEEALKPMLDIDGALWFLALDNALVNNDGYWIRASDYSLYRDPKGKFHVIPHDANETFQSNAGFGPPGGGMGRGGPRRGPGGGRPGLAQGPGGGPRPGGDARAPQRATGIELDPLVGANDNQKPLRSRLLAVPALKARYLAHVRTIAVDWLDWAKLKPVVEHYRSLIEKEIEDDTRKLTSLSEFQKSVADAIPASGEGPRSRAGLGLKAFAEARRAYLLNYPGIKESAPRP